ncbi:MAG: arginine repressor [Paludibacteraceae bacterium]|nr:arginine repressor [Paludibacteraceae bacterium]
MKNKSKRFAAIQEIISNSVVGSQEELLHRLAERDFILTQATLSRDLKQMKVLKTINSYGEYVYQMPAQVVASEEKVSMEKYMSANICTSVDFSSNIVVIHTKPGYASSLASEIDEQANDAILGTVAGDDTIFAVKKENLTQQEVIEALSRVIPTIKR